MKRDDKAGGADNKDKKEGAGPEIPRHTNKYSQLNVNLLKLRTVKEDKKAKDTDNKDKFKNVETEIFFYINKHS